MPRSSRPNSADDPPPPRVDRFGSDVLSILVRMHDEEGGLTDEELVGQAAVLFSAAHMTTAHSLSWTLFLLGEHPMLMRRLWNEWHRRALTTVSRIALAEGSTWGDTDSDGESEESLSLLDRVIKESMRVLPAPPIRSESIRGRRTGRIGCRAAPGSCLRRW